MSLLSIIKDLSQRNLKDLSNNELQILLLWKQLIYISDSFFVMLKHRFSSLELAITIM